MTAFNYLPNQNDHVLVASPNLAVRRRLLEGLQMRTRRVEQASGGAEALVHLEKGFWQTLFLDRHLPDLDAEELGRTVRERFPSVEVILLDDYEESVRAHEQSLDDADSCRGQVPKQENAEANRESKWEDFGSELPNDGHDDNAPELPGMIGNSASMRHLYRMTRLVAPRDTTVLISGPTGSGKELVARALHRLSHRSSRTFGVVNCAAIPETLLEAELFGYTRGAFTGALQSYAGRIQAAHLGTLFLDEIGDMPLSLQPKLLRFLEQKELQRLGSSQVVSVDVRVVAATNADLPRLIDEGRFREDLYYRLSAFLLVIPSLRERPADIVPLANLFLEKLSLDVSSDSRPPVLSSDSAELLEAQAWKGNVRELQNVMERAFILASNARVIRPEHLIFCGRGPASLCKSDDLPLPSTGMRAF